MPQEARVIIGQISGAHGVKGEVKIRPLTDYPERFLDMEELSLYRDGQLVGTFAVNGMRDTLSHGYFLAALKGVDDMDRAQDLRGCSVEILPSERVPLEEGEYWISDLIGLDAFDTESKRLGIVKDIVDSGPSQLIVVTDDGGKDHLVPAVPEFLVGADLAARRVELQLIEGLWEL